MFTILIMLTMLENKITDVGDVENIFFKLQKFVGRKKYICRNVDNIGDVDDAEKENVYIIFGIMRILVMLIIVSKNYLSICLPKTTTCRDVDDIDNVADAEEKNA